MSNLSAFGYIQERSQATPGLFNLPLSIISANIAAIDSGLTSSSPSGNTFSFLTNIETSGGAHFQFLSVGSTPPSYVTTAAITMEVNSAYSDYLYLVDSSAQKSSYVIGSRAGNLADGLNIWDASAGTMIASFSKQSVRFFQNVVGPVFDTGGALASTYNAATFGIGANSKESRIQAAINQASTDGVKRVYIPANMYPYSASSVSFIDTVQMVREGGSWDLYDVRAYGAKGDGIASDASTFAAAISPGGTVFASRGTYLLQILGVTPKRNQVIFGDGMGATVLLVQATAATPNTTYMSISTDNLTFHDLTFCMDVNGQAAANAISLDGNCENITFSHVEFSGLTSATGHRALLINSSRNTAVYFNRCRFKQLEFALLKPNADTSTQRFFGWANCQFSQCSDAININSPMGAFQDVSITDSDFERISNFPLAFSGPSCNRATVHGNHFSMCSIEAIHSEATASDIKIIGNDFVQCNLNPGTVGAVNIITGSKDIVIANNTFDLTQNSTGTALGISVQPGGGGPCNSVAVTGNTFKCTTGTVALLVSTTSNVVITDNVFSNVTATSQTTYFCDISFSRVHADNNIFFNPKALFRIDDNTETGLSGSRLDMDSLMTFSFITGNTNGSTSVPTNNFAIRQPFTADQAPSFQTLFPVGTLLDGTVGMRFVQNGTSATFVEKANLRWDGVALTVSSIATNNGSSSVVAPTVSDWTVIGTNVLARPGASGSTTTGRLSLVFSGIYFP